MSTNDWDPGLLPAAPLPRTYWVGPSLLAGAYPGSAMADDANEKVRALCQAGVTLFIDLTDTDDPLEPYGDLVAAPARWVRLAVRDMSTPSPDVIRRCLDLIDAETAAGGITYVHCWGGIGRTGSIIGCWLAERVGGERALGRLAELRADCEGASRRSPETDAQRRLVAGWPDAVGR